MSDFAGAAAAMRTFFTTAWASTTPVMMQNGKAPQQPWPPVDGNGSPVPWVYLEVTASHSGQRGAGKPGNQTWLTLGHVFVHLFAAKGSDIAPLELLLVQAGSIFRGQTLYSSGAGAKVVMGAPLESGGLSDADNGNQFGMTCAIPFEFFFLA